MLMKGCCSSRCGKSVDSGSRFQRILSPARILGRPALSLRSDHRNRMITEAFPWQSSSSSSSSFASLYDKTAMGGPLPQVRFQLDANLPSVMLHLLHRTNLPCRRTTLTCRNGGRVNVVPVLSFIRLHFPVLTASAS